MFYFGVYIMKWLYKFILVLCVVFFISMPVINSNAHPGSLDSKGGHYNRTTGEYHYHTGYNTGKENTLIQIVGKVVLVCSAPVLLYFFCTVAYDIIKDKFRKKEDRIFDTDEEHTIGERLNKIGLSVVLVTAVTLITIKFWGSAQITIINICLYIVIVVVSIFMIPLYYSLIIYCICEAIEKIKKKIRK